MAPTILSCNIVENGISTLQSLRLDTLCPIRELPGATGCRDAFDTLSSATVGWLVTDRAEEIRQKRLEFDLLRISFRRKLILGLAPVEQPCFLPVAHREI